MLPRTIQHPARLVPLAFLVVVFVGTSLLMLPIARAGPGGAPLLTALFTATSAVCVTGLSLYDTSTYWSGFGQVVILLLFQVGGLGIMTGATLLGLLVTRRLRLSNRLVAQAETRSIALGDVAGVMRLILIVTVGVEAAIAAILTLRLRYAYEEPWDAATWNGVFHAVSAFTNAGFSTYPDSVMRFVADPWIILPIIVAVILGGLGFPVLYEVRRKPRQPARWSVHTKITLLGTAVLLLGGFVAVLALRVEQPGDARSARLGRQAARSDLSLRHDTERRAQLRRHRQDAGGNAHRQLRADADRRRQRRHGRGHQGHDLLPARVRGPGGSSRRARRDGLPATHLLRRPATGAQHRPARGRGRRRLRRCSS